MRRLGLVAALLMGGLGCVTSGRGDTMERSIRDLQDRVDAMDRRDTEINEQVVRLRKVLDQATALLSRNSADVGAKVQKSEADIATLTGQLEEAKHILTQLQKGVQDQGARIASLEQTQTKIVDRVAPNIPEDKEQLWREAQSRLSAGQREEARRFLTAFLQRFPQDPRGAHARLLLGQSFAQEGKHTNALGEYSKVIDQYPKAPEVAEALWLMASSYAAMKLCTDARGLLLDLVKKYPRHPRANDAKQKTRELQRLARDKSACTS